MSTNDYYYEGLEVGAVSVKWVRRKNGSVTSEIVRHEGKPRQKIQDIFRRHNVGDNSRVVTTSQATLSILDLPYFSEVECIERALSHLNVQPNIVISLGGETFSVYPMKDGIIKNIISSSKCAAGTGEFIVQQFQRMGLSIEEGIQISLNGHHTQLATRCSVHCKSDATHKLNKGECHREDIAKTLIHDLARKVKEMIEQALNYINIGYRGCLRLNQLLENLLDTSRLDSKKMELRYNKENIVKIIEDCTADMNYLADQRNLSIQLDLPDEFYMNIDKLRFSQVITNIISNAIKNTQPKGRIYITLTDNDDHIDIKIKDTGVGFTPEEEKLLFQKFGKIERYGKDYDVDIEGCGLGLYISKEIVELHGGQILAESKGLNKVLYLP